MKKAASIKFNEIKLLIITDISWETLVHRRALKPLSNQLQAKNIDYIFPACLIAKKSGYYSYFAITRRLKIILQQTRSATCQLGKLGKETPEMGEVKRLTME